MWLSRKCPIIWCESLIDRYFLYWNNLIENQKNFPQMRSNILRKNLSSFALNGWAKPNLGYSIYRYVCIKLWQDTCIFACIVELFAFHLKIANFAITCKRLRFSRCPAIVFRAWLYTLRWSQSHLRRSQRCRLDSQATPWYQTPTCQRRHPWKILCMLLKSALGTTSITQSKVGLKLYNRSDRPQEAEVCLADFEPKRVVVFTPNFTPVTCRLITFLLCTWSSWSLQFSALAAVSQASSANRPACTSSIYGNGVRCWRWRLGGDQHTLHASAVEGTSPVVSWSQRIVFGLSGYAWLHHP